MSTPQNVKSTPFIDFHRALGAKLVEFAGFEMPLRYTGDVREHQCVRNAVGVFDITHMGEYHVARPGRGRVHPPHGDERRARHGGRAGDLHRDVPPRRRASWTTCSSTGCRTAG